MSSTDPIKQFKRIGIVGAGNMGSMMAFAFSELGLDVSVWDVKTENVDSLLEQAREGGKFEGKIDGYYKADKFTQSLGQEGTPKLFMFSITHGNPADSVLKKIKSELKKGDIILDGGNEHYRNTERRQKECAEMGVHWIGMGVSGGYQSARRGPSMSPGGDSKTLDQVLPLLKMYAARDPKTGDPCVTKIGPGGSGHYVKMVHNGIEVGMLSAVCEAWSLLRTGLGLTNDEVGDIFAKWNDSGELKTNYLVRIGSEICKTRKSNPEDGYVLDDVLDKVVQDDDSSEGTPTWAVMESDARHVSCPTLAAGLYFRTASGNRAERVHVAKKLSAPSPEKFDGVDKQDFIERLRQAVYCSFLASYCQGLELISKASEDENWDINLGECIRIWRAGCIIQSEYIADMFEPELKDRKHMSNMKLIDRVAQELKKNQLALKHIVLKGIEKDHYVPALSATLEYIKYIGGTELPTQFMEAEMDYFGAHSYDKRGDPNEDPGKTAKGHHHYEWKPA